MPNLRLWLIGEDPALDVLAELSQHLDYFSVARLDEPPPEMLGPDDHIVIGLGNRQRSLAVLALVLARGQPGAAVAMPLHDGDNVGTRAIVAGAELVTVLRIT
jgi:hypothetical protein